MKREDSDSPNRGRHGVHEAPLLLAPDATPTPAADCAVVWDNIVMFNQNVHILPNRNLILHFTSKT